MKYVIKIETGIHERPKDYELSAAMLVSEYFQADVLFLRPSSQRTPDLDINGIKWELKSPLGNSKNTIKNNLHSARTQSENIILDLRRAKIHQAKALANVRYYFSSHKSKIKHLLVITKSEKILEIL